MLAWNLVRTYGTEQSEEKNDTGRWWRMRGWIVGILIGSQEMIQVWRIFGHTKVTQVMFPGPSSHAVGSEGALKYCLTIERYDVSQEDGRTQRKSDGYMKGAQ